MQIDRAKRPVQRTGRSSDRPKTPNIPREGLRRAMMVPGCEMGGDTGSALG